MMSNIYNPYLKMRWENPENYRYYEAIVDRDLFGWVLTRIWGRIGTRLGQVSHQPCCSFEEGKSKTVEINKIRQQRGYFRVSENRSKIHIIDQSSEKQIRELTLSREHEL